MIPKSFNEEILVTEHGPKLEVTYDTSFVFEGSRQFKSEVEYDQRYATKRYESSLSLCPETREYVYRECVELSPRLRAHTYSETIYAFPKTVDKVYTTTLRHWDNFVETRYVTGVKLVPAARLKSPGKMANGNHLAYRQSKSLDDDTLLKDCPDKTEES